MTVLDKFMRFARSLPDAQVAPFEAALSELMECFSERYAFTAEELDEIDRRAADKDAEFSDPAAIDNLLGKPSSP